jgi:hypothetical protein
MATVERSGGNMTELKCFKCDGCGKIIESAKDSYKIVMVGEKYYTGPGNSDYDQKVKKLDFCERCARNIKTSLENISKRGVHL